MRVKKEGVCAFVFLGFGEDVFSGARSRTRGTFWGTSWHFASWWRWECCHTQETRRTSPSLSGMCMCVHFDFFEGSFCCWRVLGICTVQHVPFAQKLMITAPKWKDGLSRLPSGYKSLKCWDCCCPSTACAYTTQDCMNEHCFLFHPSF